MDKRIVIFASGNGTNAQNIIEFFQHHPHAKVVHVLSNKQHAKVIERAKRLNIDTLVFSKDGLKDPEGILKTLQQINPDLIVLSGFLLMFPAHILKEFPNKVINIHPALLPKFGGKGMYGKYVHEAVIAAQEKETGITIHYVNEAYDEGAIIFQAKVAVFKSDTPEDVAKKVHQLEYEYFPKVIEQILFPKENPIHNPEVNV